MFGQVQERITQSMTVILTTNVNCQKVMSSSTVGRERMDFVWSKDHWSGEVMKEMAGCQPNISVLLPFAPNAKDIKM